MTVRDPDFDESVRAEYSPQHVEVLGRSRDPADLLFELDEVQYTERRQQWRARQRAELLGQDDFEKPIFDRNVQRFEDLRRLVGRGRLVPFLGAGIGVPCRLPTWRAFLVQTAREHSAQVAAEVDTFLAADHFEEAAEHLVTTLREPRFAETFDRMFAVRSSIPDSPILRELQPIVRGCVVTTNFDRLIEIQLGLSDVFLGRAATEFHRALADGEPALLKLHGDLRGVENRVLTRGEYDTAYGSGDEPDLSLALPDALYRMFGHHRLLFLGCSLGPDRTLRVLHKLVRLRGEARFPRHYAIIEAPTDRTALNDRESFLNDRMIFPIWYPAGAHQVVPALLRDLGTETR